MEIRGARVSGAIALLAIALAPTAQARVSSSPTARTVRAAVRKAERSPYLWATVNVCNTRRHPNTIGIRGQMPSLGFSARLRMRFSVEYWTGSAFMPLRGVNQTITFGVTGTGVHQAGATFGFSPHAGTLRGSVQFEWRLRSRLIGEAVRLTRSGHRDADFGDPRRFSSAHCSIR